MGFFDFLFGSRAPKFDDPEQLRQHLFEAAQRGDHKQVERLCRVNRDGVIEHFPAWRTVIPQRLRDDQPALQSYVQGLLTVAQTFAQRLGAPELLQLLVGSEQDNPLLRWQSGLRRAQELMADCHYGDARDLLSNLLIDVRALRGSGVDSYLPITLGHLAQCYFQGREGDKAVPHFEQALHLCEQSNDKEGVLAYLGNLYELYRYLAQPELAASYCERLAAALEEHGRPVEARRYRIQTGIVRGGEPLNRVVAMVDGVRYELDEVGVVEGKRVQFAFERNRTTLRVAAELTRRGEELGRHGRLEEALTCFRDAAQADPFDPDARYQEAYTLLHLQRYLQAVEGYQATEELAPGWFHCRCNLWIAQQLSLGNLAYDTGVAVLVLEDSPLSPNENISLAEQILSRAPNLAMAHLLLGKSLTLLGRVPHAQRAYRQGLACAAEPDIKTRLLVELGVLSEDQQERASLLHEAQALNGNLVAAAQATVALKAFGARA